MIFVCRNCGKENYLPDIQRQDGAYYCVKCHKLLTVAIGEAFRKDIQQKDNSRKTGAFNGYLLIAIFAVIALVWIVSDNASLRPKKYAPSSFPAIRTPNMAHVIHPADLNRRRLRPHKRLRYASESAPKALHEAIAPIYVAPQSNNVTTAYQVPSVTHSASETAAATSSLPNGTEIVRQGNGGMGSLTISNGTDDDAVVKLVGGSDSLQGYVADPAHPSDLNLDNKTYYEIYVGRGREAEITSIGQGAYRVLFCLGNGWQERTQRFGDVRLYSSFEDPLVFTQTVEDADGGQKTHFHRYSITLNATVDGTAHTNDISASEFDNAAK